MISPVVLLLAVPLNFGGPFAAWPLVAPIDFAPSNQPQFVRCTLEPHADVLPNLRVVDETGAEVPYVVDPDIHRIGGPPAGSTAALVARSDRPQPLQQPAGSTSAAWVFDLGATAASSAVRVPGDAGGSVELDAGPDGMLWHQVADGRLSPKAALAFPEEENRYWRLTVRQADGVPLSVVPVLLVKPHDLLFEAMPGHTYAVLEGNLAAPGPDYDLGARLERENWTSVTGTIEAPVANEAFTEGRPIVERFPWIVPGVLGAGALVLLLLAIRVLRRPAKVDDFRAFPPTQMGGKTL